MNQSEIQEFKLKIDEESEEKENKEKPQNRSKNESDFSIKTYLSEEEKEVEPIKFQTEDDLLDAEDSPMEFKINLDFLEELKTSKGINNQTINSLSDKINTPKQPDMINDTQEFKKTNIEPTYLENENFSKDQKDSQIKPLHVNLDEPKIDAQTVEIDKKIVIAGTSVAKALRKSNNNEDKKPKPLPSVSNNINNKASLNSAKITPKSEIKIKNTTLQTKHQNIDKKDSDGKLTKAETTPQSEPKENIITPQTQPQNIEKKALAIESIEEKSHTIENESKESVKVLPNKNILIFRKNPIETHIFSNILDSFVQTIEKCETLEEFEQELKNYHFDVIIFDYDTDNIDFEKISHAIDESKEHPKGKTNTIMFAKNSQSIPNSHIRMFDKTIQSLINKSELERIVKSYLRR